MKPIRWTGDGDRYFGPFTYANEGRSSKLALMLGSGDGDDYPGCRLHFSLGTRTLIAALPSIIKPQAKWHEITTEPTRSQMMAQGRKPGYFNHYEREYGFSFVEGSLHLHYGAQTHEWPGSKSKVFLAPWREHKKVRHSLYDLEGRHFADLPDWGFKNPNGYTVRNAIEAVCPSAKFEFADFDGEHIIATCKIEEREWKRGKGIFRLLFIGRNTVRRSLDLQFSAEVGKRKGSWKGGTVGHGIDMLPGELHEAAFRRYCDRQGLTFIGEVRDSDASLAEDRDSGLSGEAVAARAEGIAQNQSEPSS